MLFFSLYYDILSLTSLKITQAFHLLLGFVENQTIFWDFKIRNSVRITEGSGNGDSDNRGPTVPTPIICGDKSDDTRKVCFSRCCLVMLCGFTSSCDYRLY